MDAEFTSTTLLREIRDLLWDRLPEDRCPHGYRLRSSCPACSDAYAPDAGKPQFDDDAADLDRTTRDLGRVAHDHIDDFIRVVGETSDRGRIMRSLRAALDAADEALAACRAEAGGRIDTLRAEVERLTRERDEWKARALDRYDRLKSAEALAARYREALESLRDRDLRWSDLHSLVNAALAAAPPEATGE